MQDRRVALLRYISHCGLGPRYLFNPLTFLSSVSVIVSKSCLAVVHHKQTEVVDQLSLPFVIYSEVSISFIPHIFLFFYVDILEELSRPPHALTNSPSASFSRLNFDDDDASSQPMAGDRWSSRNNAERLERPLSQVGYWR